MIRHVAAIALAMCLNPSWLFAQTARLTVGVQSADVHRNPSMGSPVIGHAPLGTSIEIKRDLGSWVAVAWPSGDYGVGYMHVLTGTIARDALSRNPNDPLIAPVFSSTPPKSARNVMIEPPRPREELATPRRPPTPPSHILAVGGRVGPTTMGAGGSARMWRDDRFGGQLVFAHTDLVSTLIPEHLSSTVIEPSMLYEFGNRMGEYLWMRPYVGTGVHLRHQTLRHPNFAQGTSQTRLGAQAFGGAEFAISTLPRFTVSLDIGYHWAQDPVPAYDLKGVGAAFSAHWYVK